MNFRDADIDRTYCGSNCVNTLCDRWLSPDAPIHPAVAFADFSPDCETYIAPDEAA